MQAPHVHSPLPRMPGWTRQAAGQGSGQGRTAGVLVCDAGAGAGVAACLRGAGARHVVAVHVCGERLAGAGAAQDVALACARRARRLSAPLLSCSTPGLGFRGVCCPA